MEKHGDHDQADHGNRDGGGSDGEDKGSTGRPALAPDKAPSAERTPKAVEQAEKLRKSSEIEEPKVTSMMEGVVKAIGGEFGEVEGVSSLETRLKSTESLARKIDADAEKDHEGDREKAAQGISDAIRYTINVDDANYTDGLEKAVKAVEENGWKIRDVKNFWQEGDPYNGVHIKMSKDGVQVEVQLHTPDSHRVKEGGLHDVYDIYRESKDNVERQSLWDSMIKTARTIPTPANAQKLLTVGTLVFQTYETAQQAGLTKSTGVNIIWIMSREGVAVCGILPN
jgi:translation elongation factor EF-1beta